MWKKNIFEKVINYYILLDNNIGYNIIIQFMYYIKYIIYYLR